MRTILIIYILATSIHVVGQKYNKYPFQVVDSNNAFLKNRKAIKRLDLLSRHDVIELKKGTVLLVHYTGLPIRLKGDTVVNLKSLNDQFNESTRKIRDGRPRIEWLFSDKPILRTMTYDYIPPFIYPPPGTVLTHNIEDDLCLRWNSGKVNSYSLEIRNIFDDTLKTYYSETNSLVIPSDELKKFAGGEPALLISFRSDNKPSAQIACRLIRNHEIKGLFECTTVKPERALMIGYYLECAGLLLEAKEYYNLAKSLSDDKVFNEIAEHFEMRSR